MALFACIMASAQKALFDKYSETDGVSTVYISHKMMRMMGNVKAGNKDISKIASRLDYLQILSCERRSLIPSIKKTAQSIFSQQRFSVVMQVNEGTDHRLKAIKGSYRKDDTSDGTEKQGVGL